MSYQVYVQSSHSGQHLYTKSGLALGDANELAKQAANSDCVDASVWRVLTNGQLNYVREYTAV